MALHKFKGHMALLVSNLLFGMNFSYFVSIIREYLSFQNLWFARVLFSALFFIPFALTSRRYRITLRDFLRILLVTVLIIFGKQYMMLWGARYTNPIDASTIATLGPIFTLIVSSLVMHEDIHAGKVIGIVLGISGALLLIFGNGLPIGGGEELGNLFIFVSVVCAATNTVLIKPVLMELSTPVVMGWYYILGMALSAPFFLEDFLQVDFKALPLNAYLEIGYVIILGTILPNFLLYYGTEKLTSVHTALYYYAQPVIATVLALVRRQETLDPANYVSMGLIFLGVVLVIISYKRFKFPVPRVERMIEDPKPGKKGTGGPKGVVQ